MNLHDEIMNIPCDNPTDWELCGKGQDHAYRVGHKHARHAAAELALEAVVKWQPIDTSPKDGTNLLLGWYEDWPERKWIAEVASAGNVDVATPGTAYLHGRATHWMSLPDAPGKADSALNV